MEFLKQCLMNFGGGAIVGVLFFFIKLPIPGPPAIPPIFGILGITVTYLLMTHYLGGK
jgi:XapX domain-containing protein